MRIKKELSLYLHIPFCVKKCIYCDFLSFSSSQEMREEYVRAICKEILSYREYKEEYRIKTIFIGGGTPSLLSEEQVEKIFHSLFVSFDLAEVEEITIEANPGTVTGEKLNCFRQLGVNRLSIGLQSTEEKELLMLGRIHSYKEFLYGYEEARKQGFQNINIDLMMSLPGQTRESYIRGLDKIMKLHPEHISSYSLIVEEGTPLFYNDVLLKQLPSEEEERKMYDLTGEILEKNGYQRYEISNYAKQSFSCKHNIVYWKQGDYLGIGLGASSCFRGARFKNEEDFRSYLKNPYILIENRAEYTVLSQKEKMEEYMYLGLRMTEGVSKIEFLEKFQIRIEEIYGSILEKYKKLELLEESGDVIRFTKRGIDVSNQVLWEFLL